MPPKVLENNLDVDLVIKYKVPTTGKPVAAPKCSQ